MTVASGAGTPLAHELCGCGRAVDCSGPQPPPLSKGVVTAVPSSGLSGN